MVSNPGRVNPFGKIRLSTSIGDTESDVAGRGFGFSYVTTSQSRLSNVVFAAAIGHWSLGRVCYVYVQQAYVHTIGVQTMYIRMICVHTLGIRTTRIHTKHTPTYYTHTYNMRTYHMRTHVRHAYIPQAYMHHAMST